MVGRAKPSPTVHIQLREDRHLQDEDTKMFDGKSILDFQDVLIRFYLLIPLMHLRFSHAR